MNRPPRLSTEQLEERHQSLCRKYPNINPKQGEDLNIERNTNRIFLKLYYNEKERLTIEQISKIMGISDRTLFRLLQKNRIKATKAA